jgi:hypothetical protein
MEPAVTYTLCKNNYYVVLKILFFLYCFWWTRSPFLYLLSSAFPQRTAYTVQWSSIPEGSTSKDGQSTVEWRDCQLRTQDYKFTVWCYYQSATSTLLRATATPLRGASTPL